MHQLNQTTLKVCRESGGICIDLERELDFKDEDFYDLTHNTPGGAQKIGHYLAEKLKPPLQRNPKIIT